MSDPLDTAAHALEISDSNSRMSYRQAAEQVVRVYLSAKVEEMQEPALGGSAPQVRFKTAGRAGAWVPSDVLLGALLPVVSEDGGANQ